METISDSRMLQERIKSAKIHTHFESHPQGFQLRRYQKGELLTAPFWPLGHFLFILQGRIKIYGLREDGSSFSISRGVHGAMLGDMEFARRGFPSFYTEALEEVLCIALPIEENREVLQRDCTFLRYLLSCMSEKVFMFSMIGRSAQPVGNSAGPYAARHFRRADAASLQPAAAAAGGEKALRTGKAGKNREGDLPAGRDRKGRLTLPEAGYTLGSLKKKAIQPLPTYGILSGQNNRSVTEKERSLCVFGDCADMKQQKALVFSL